MGYLGPSAVQLRNRLLSLAISGQGAKSALWILTSSETAWRLESVCSAPVSGAYQPSHCDTKCVERDHRSGKKTHVQDVGGGGDDCCANKNGQYGVAQVPPHPA